MVKAGKPPAVKSVPIRAASTKHKPAWQIKQEEENKQGQIGFNQMRGPGRTIGVQNLKKEEKWRCATCKFTNDNELTECGRCRDPKKVFKEAPIPRGSSHGAMGAQKPMRYTNANAQQAKPI